MPTIIHAVYDQQKKVKDVLYAYSCQTGIYRVGGINLFYYRYGTTVYNDVPTFMVIPSRTATYQV